MSTTLLLNPDNTLKALKSQLNAELTKAAEPVIQRALIEAEHEMRQRLAVHLVAMIDRSYSLERHGDRLTIVVDRGQSA